MGVKEIIGRDSFNSAINVPQLVVVDFFGEWCGPCRNIAPFVEELSNKHTEVIFIKVDVDKNQELVQECQVSAFPTFHFFVNGNKVDEMRGANPSALESKVTSLKVSAGPYSFEGKGQTLGSSGSHQVWDGVGNPPGQENARAARLKAFGHIDNKKKTDEDSKKSISSADEDEEIARAIAMSMSPDEQSTDDVISHKDKKDDCVGKDGDNVDNNGEDWDGEEMVPVPVDETLLTQLISMEIPDVRARKGLVHGKSVEGALAWLEENQDDPDIDQPYMVKRKDTIPKKPLTAEEKAAKVQQLKEKAARVKKEREAKEAAEALQREKERRNRGQNLGETEEERNRMQRKREAAKKKKEKEDAIKERARLRAEIARDKELRKANNGVIPSKLGVEGYNPSAVQYDKKETRKDETGVNSAPAKSSSSVPSQQKKPKVAQSAEDVKSDPIKVIDTAVAAILRYRTGGDGGQALKLLHLLLRNVLNNPTEEKYRSINLEGKAYKGKLAHLVGPSALLKAVGFRLNETEDKLILPQGEGDLIGEAVKKIAAAEEQYAKMNA